MSIDGGILLLSTHFIHRISKPNKVMALMDSYLFTNISLFQPKDAQIDIQRMNSIAVHEIIFRIITYWRK